MTSAANVVKRGGYHAAKDDACPVLDDIQPSRRIGYHDKQSFSLWVDEQLTLDISPANIAEMLCSVQPMPDIDVTALFEPPPAGKELFIVSRRTA